jgi:hypothetical protein
MVEHFLSKTMMPHYQAATEGIEKNSWGRFLVAVHTVKGSIG